MAAKTFWFYDVSAGGFGKLDEGSAPTAADTTTHWSWSANGLGPNGYSGQIITYGTTVTSTDGIAPASSTPSAGITLRSLNPITGDFDTGVWQFVLEIGRITGASSANTSWGSNFRIYRSVNADSSSFTLVSGTSSSNVAQGLATPQTLTANSSPIVATTFTNEYIFIVFALNISTIVNTSGEDCVRVGVTKLVTPNFTPPVYNVTLSELASPTDSLSAQQVFACPITETPIISWGSSGVHWGWVDAVWGGATLIEWGSTANYTGLLVSEPVTASDSINAANIMSASLAESRTVADSFVPELVFNFTLNESRTPTDSLTTTVTFTQSLTEALANYWGTAGILWGDTTGTWGGDVQDSLSSTQVFVSSYVESRTATDSYVGNTIFPNTLSESATPLDSYTPALIVTVTLTESGTASESLTANNIMVNSLVEVLANYWGSSGILWGASTGVWGGDVQDSLSSQQVFACPLAETVSALDSYISIQIFVSSLSESVTATDVYIPNLVITQSLLEASGAIDLLTTQQIFTNFLLEFRTATDTLTYALIGSTSNIVVVDPTLSLYGVTAITDPLGVDIHCFPDFDPLGVLVLGFKALSQRIARRLTNRRGTWFWAPNECTDVRSYLNDIMTGERMSVIQHEIEREVLREEAVKTVASTISFDAQSSNLIISLAGMTKEGPFKFVFDVSSTKLTILN